MAKQNDWIIASLNNPEFTPTDFKVVADMNLSNTQLLPSNIYKRSESITSNPMFQTNGNFDENKFDLFYAEQAKKFGEFSLDNKLDDPFEYNMWDVTRKKDSKIKNPNFSFDRLPNPDHKTLGVGGPFKSQDSKYSKKELAQRSKIYDSKTGEFKDDSVNDMSFFKNPIKYIKSLFDEPLVYATYDEDTEELDPRTGQLVHHNKGEWKLNEDGEYYTETLNGRSLIGKEVVSAGDYVSEEGSFMDKYDFFDSDGLDKSVTGTIAKNLTAVAPMLFLGPTGLMVYGGLYVGREMLKTLPMMHGMMSSFTGQEYKDNKLFNTLAAYGNRLTTGTSEYAQQHTFAGENFVNLMGEVALQWGQQKAIANAWTKLNTSKAQSMEAAYAKAANEYASRTAGAIKDGLSGKLSAGKIVEYTGIDRSKDIAKMLTSKEWEKTIFGKNALEKHLGNISSLLEGKMKTGQDLSLVYMSLISNTDVYDSVLEAEGTRFEAAAIALGSTLGMFGVDKYLGLGEIFFDDPTARKAYREGWKKGAQEFIDVFSKGVKNTPEAVRNSKGKLLGLMNQAATKSKNFVNKFHEDLKNHTLGFTGKALGEGLEEVSEELVSDASKALGELAGHFGLFTQTDYGAFENPFERYMMSFLGGAAGGGMFYGVEAYQKRNNPKAKQGEDELIYLIRNHKKEDLMKELDILHKKGKLGSTTLSWETVKDSDGNDQFLTANSQHESQNDYVYRKLKEVYNHIDSIVNNNKVGLTEDELFDNMILSDIRMNALRDYTKDKSYITRYQEDFQNIAKKLVEKDLEIEEYIKSANDETVKKTDEFKNHLAELQAEKKELETQRDDFLSGKNSLHYIKKMQFAIDPKISSYFMTVTLDQYIREKYGKTIEDLSLAEKQSVQLEYQNYAKDQKYDLDKAFALYEELESKVLSDLESIKDIDFKNEAERFKKLQEKFPEFAFSDWNTKLESESQEQYDNRNNIMEGESEEDFKKRKEKRTEEVKKAQDADLAKIQEYAELGLDSSNFRLMQVLLGKRAKDIVESIVEGYGLSETRGKLLTVDDVNEVKDLLTFGRSIEDIYKEVPHLDKNDIDFIKKSLDENLKTNDILRNDRSKKTILLREDTDFIRNLLRNGDDTKTIISKYKAFKKNQLSKEYYENPRLNDDWDRYKRMYVKNPYQDASEPLTRKQALEIAELIMQNPDADFNEIINPESEDPVFSKETIDELKTLLELKKQLNALTELRSRISQDVSEEFIATGKVNPVPTEEDLKIIDEETESRLALERVKFQNLIADVFPEYDIHIDEHEKALAPLTFDELSSTVEVELNKTMEVNEDTVADQIDQDAEAISQNLLTMVDKYDQTLDTFVNALKTNPYIRMFKVAEENLYKNNPTLQFFAKVSAKFGNTDVNVEDFLQSIYQRYQDIENFQEFEVTPEEKETLLNLKTNLQTARAIIYAASKDVDVLSPIGQNKQLNEFIKNHPEIFGKDQLLPEVNSETGNLMILELSNYEREIDMWLNRSNENIINKNKMFVQSEQKLNEAIHLFYESNRNAFIVKGVDLLEGYNPDESNLHTERLLYNNVQKALRDKTLTLNDVFSIIDNITNLENVGKQVPSKLDNKLQALNDYDKFTYFITTIAMPIDQYRKRLKQFIDDNDQIVPIGLQMYCGRVEQAMQINPDVVNKALDYVNSKLKVKLNTLHNTTIGTGVGGSGKSEVIGRIAIDDAGLTTWVAGPAIDQALGLKEKLPKAKEYTVDDILKVFLGDTLFNNLNQAIETKNSNSDLFSVTNVNGNNKFTLKNKLLQFIKVNNLPKHIVVDEATHIPEVKLQLLSKIAETYKINLLLLGDTAQSGFNNGFMANLGKLQMLAWRTPKLYISLRDANVQKYYNQQGLLQMVDPLIDAATTVETNSQISNIMNNLLPKFAFRYHIGEKLSGEYITNDVSDNIINILKSNVDANKKQKVVGFIGDSNSPIYKKLQDAGVLVTKPMDIVNVQGKEYDYVVVDINWDEKLNPNNLVQFGKYFRKLYTVITRSKEGTVIIDNGLSKQFNSKKDIATNKVTDVKSAIKEFRESVLADLSQPIPKSEEPVSEVQGEGKADGEESSEGGKGEDGTTPEEESEGEDGNTDTELDPENLDRIKQDMEEETPEQDKKEIEEVKKLNDELDDEINKKIELSYTLDFPVRGYANIHIANVDIEQETLWPMPEYASEASFEYLAEHCQERNVKGEPVYTDSTMQTPIDLIELAYQHGIIKANPRKPLLIYGEGDHRSISIDSYDEAVKKLKRAGFNSFRQLAQTAIPGKSVWVGNGSNSDIGIFLKKGNKVKVDSTSQDKYVNKVLQLKCLLIFGQNYYDLAHSDIQSLFDKSAFNPENVEYYLKAQDITSDKQLFGLTNLDNNKRDTYRGKLITVEARLRGNDGQIYTVTLGAACNPETWESGVKADDTESLSMITTYRNFLDELINGTSKEEKILFNPSKLSDIITKNPDKSPVGNLNLMNFDGGTPFDNKNKYAKRSRIHFITKENEDLFGKDLVGKNVMFITPNVFLKPDDLMNLYLRQRTRGEEFGIRMFVLNNKGISFKSLYNQDLREKFKIDGSTNELPFMLVPQGLRMYISMWNFRSNLQNFLINYNEWKNDVDGTRGHELSDNDVLDLIKEEQTLFNEYSSNFKKSKKINEAEFRTWIKENKPEETYNRVKQIWDFNDGLAKNVRQFRLGYNSNNGFIIRQLTNLGNNNPLYAEKQKKLKNNKTIFGVYITPDMANTYLDAMNALFENVLDKILPPPSKVTTDENGEEVIEAISSRIWIDKAKTLETESDTNWVKDKIKDRTSLNIQGVNESGEISNSSLNFVNESAFGSIPATMLFIGRFLDSRARRMSDFDEDWFDETITEKSKKHQVYISDPADPDNKDKRIYLNYVQIATVIGQEENDKTGDYRERPGFTPFSTDKHGIKVGNRDERLDNLFSLMFHGSVELNDTNFENQGILRATDADFKYGFKVDGMGKKKTSENAFGLIATNEMFFSADALIAFPQFTFQVERFINPESIKKPSTQKAPPVNVQTETDTFAQNKKVLIKQVNTLSGLNLKEKTLTNINSLENLVNYANSKLNPKFANGETENEILNIKKGSKMYQYFNQKLSGEITKLIDHLEIQNGEIVPVYYQLGIEVDPDFKEEWIQNNNHKKVKDTSGIFYEVWMDENFNIHVESQNKVPVTSNNKILTYEGLETNIQNYFDKINSIDNSLEKELNKLLGDFKKLTPEQKKSEVKEKDLLRIVNNICSELDEYIDEDEEALSNVINEVKTGLNRIVKDIKEDQNNCPF